PPAPPATESLTGSATEATGSASESALAPASAPAGSAMPAEPPPSDAPLGINIAGSLQLDYLYVPTDRDARGRVFDGATAEISLKATRELGRNATASIKVCFACHGFEVGVGVVEVRATSAFRARIGRFTPSFGSFPQRHDPANHLTSDKPLPFDMGRMLHREAWNEGILPAPWVDNGLELAGTKFWDGGQFDAAVWIASGPKGSPDAADFDFTLSRAPEQYYVDNNSQPAVGGRASLVLELTERASIEVGASAMVGTYDPARSLGFALGGVDVAVLVGRLALRAEYLVKRVEMALGSDPGSRFKYGPNASGRFDDFFVKDGFYADLELPLGSVTGLARIDGLRRKGNVLATSPLESSSYLLRYTVGLATRIHAKVTLKSSVELYTSKELGSDTALHLGVATPF
ncbi:MAG: hypothetical protein ACKV2T_19340, partial [Kofleriaceae bacterium]